jgi:uncharacterized membrane protein YphA (DoxX/SURF4 family)
MSSEPTPQSRSFLDTATVLARWSLGLVFVYMGWHKVVDPVAFMKMVRQYDLVGSSLALNSIAAVLPWFEVYCGLLLLAGIAVRGSAWVLIGMLAPFTFALLHRALAIHAAQAIAFCAIKFDCGCGTGEEYICVKLPLNCLLILLSGWLLSGRGRQLCARYSLI